MRQSTTMVFIQLRAAAEAKARGAEKCCMEDFFLGLLKLCELKAGDIARDPEAAPEIDEDARAVREILTRAGIGDTRKARHTLRRTLQKAGSGADAQGSLSAAAEKAKARSASEVCARDLADAILEAPSRLLRDLLPPQAEKKEQGKGKASEAEPEAAAETGPGLQELSERVRSMRRRLKERVFGQDEAVGAFCEGIFSAQLLARSDLARKAPKAVFVFAGPPGVGKTFLAEEASEALSLPFMRFDMSGYADHQSWLGLVGFEKSYHEAAEGKLTGFVRKNPEAVLLFDEVEKAHLNTIHLFLQILDGGHLYDRFLGEDVSFRDTVVIFTTNAGRSLYEGRGRAGGPARRQRLIDALRTEKRPDTGEPFFPAAIASRLASGYALLFDALGAKDLCAISEKELQRLGGLFEKEYGIPVTFDPRVSFALLMREGKTDARTLRAATERYFKECIFKLTGLIGRDSFERILLQLKEIRFTPDAVEMKGEACTFFSPPEHPPILFCGSALSAERIRDALPGAELICALDAEDAVQKAGEREAVIVLAELAGSAPEVLPEQTVLEDSDLMRTGAGFSVMPIGAKALRNGVRLLQLLQERLPEIPVWLVRTEGLPLGEELLFGLSQLGAAGTVSADAGREALAARLNGILSAAFREGVCAKLAAKREVLTFDTVPARSSSGERLLLRLRGFRTVRAVGASDAGTLLEEASRPDVRFSDVVGASAAKEELGFFIRFLKNPAAMRAKGFRPPKGVLLYGPPGTGKTLLAKAFAGETDAAFIPASASSFVTKYQGSGPESVRNLFESARRYAPAILFIDEIDAIGRKRGELNSGHGEEMALNALLTEMDGFSTDPSRPVFVVAATNFGIGDGKGGAGELDPALVRRFDRRILVDLPDAKDREQLLQMLLAKRSGAKVSEEDIRRIAKRSVGLSPAAITDVCETAARMAVREGKALTGALLEEALELTRFGEKRDWGPRYLERVALHESGHALVSALQGRMPTYLTITARGGHGGYMEDAEGSEAPIYTKEEVLGRIRTCLAGRAAEVVFYGEEEGISTGASDDLQQATRLACAMLGCYGMDARFGLFAQSQGDAWKDGEIRREANAILAAQLREASAILEKNRKKARALADALLSRNSLNGEEIQKILGQ